MSLNLGKEVATRFAVLGMVGLVVAVGTLMLSILPGSPYGLMQPAAELSAVQIVSGFLMLFAGMFGAITSQVSEGTAARYPQIKWVAGLLTAVFVFLLYTSWNTYTILSAQAERPTSGMASLTFFAGTVVMLACFVYMLAMRYVLRVWRLHRPYG